MIFYATAYTYLNNENLNGDKVGDLELIREKSQNTSMVLVLEVQS